MKDVLLYLLIGLVLTATLAGLVVNVMRLFGWS
jgi:hypothetical protein